MKNPTSKSRESKTKTRLGLAGMGLNFHILKISFVRIGLVDFVFFGLIVKFVIWFSIYV